MKKYKNPVCIILWNDAAYSSNKKLPKILPQPQLTCGFIIESNDKFTHIATNVGYDKKTNKLTPVDGFLIPEKSIISFKKIGDLNLNEK